MPGSPSRPFVIAVTGGIASGKTAVTEALAARGVPVFDADVAAREVVAPGSEGLAEIVAAFGPGVLDAQGALDRGAMRRHVFDHPDDRRRLEAIIHPRVRQRLREQIEASGAPLAALAIPLLAEVGGRSAYPWIDRIVVVDAPDDLRLARLLARDGIDAVLARRMFAAQASREARLVIADHVLDNGGSREALAAQVDALLEALTREARLSAPNP
jgi:dephospho-CoA kinase